MGNCIFFFKIHNKNEKKYITAPNNQITTQRIETEESPKKLTND